MSTMRHPPPPHTFVSTRVMSCHLVWIAVLRRTDRATALEFLAVDVGFGLYLGWVTVATALVR